VSSGGGYWSLPINDTLYDLGDLHCTGNYPTAMYFNGNDAIVLETVTGGVVDIFGKTGTDPGTNGWNDIPPTYFAGNDYWTSWSKDQTLIRKSSVKTGVGENPDIFMVNVEWDSIPKDSWDSLGFHTCDCKPLGISQNTFNHSIVMYPNPSSSKTVTISASERIESVSIINELGQVIYSEEFAIPKREILVKGRFLEKGIYFVTTKFVDKSIYTGKLAVQ
jgi:hypothetical protein